MTIKAIETHYAGCHFRSRLEARWAVFFDHLGIRWEYEPEGYLVGPTQTKTPYLPDFWLFDLRLWAEVKGTPDNLDLTLLTHAVDTKNGLPSEPGGPSADPNGWRLLLLGPVPEPNYRVGHSVIGTYSRHADVWTVEFTSPVMTVRPGSHRPLAKRADLLTPATRPGCMPPLVTAAYTAARSARFEHGRSR